MQNALRLQVAVCIRQVTVCALLTWTVACQMATPLQREPETPAPERSVTNDPHAMHAPITENGSAGDASGVAPRMPDRLLEEPPANAIAGCDPEDPYAWAEPSADETCYELRLHNESSTTDPSPYVVQFGESVGQLYYPVPWPAGQVATRFGTQLDNLPVVREWVAFGTDEMRAPGTVGKNVTGTTLGTNAKMFARGSTGGCNVVMPDDVGLELPPPDKMVMLQWLHLNLSDSQQLDGSKLLICTVPQNERRHIASFTWLGTENLNGPVGMPDGQESTFDGTCENRSGAAITVAALWPHMHAIGTRAGTELLRVGGAIESIFDMPFDHANETHYDLSTRAVLEAGDKIRASCTYFNDTGRSVSYGMSVSQEACVLLALAYPAGALDKPGNPSLVGTTNSCWGD